MCEKKRMNCEKNGNRWREKKNELRERKKTKARKTELCARKKEQFTTKTSFCEKNGKKNEIKRRIYGCKLLMFVPFLSHLGKLLFFSRFSFV
jgi:hypothetical protein